MSIEQEGQTAPTASELPPGTAPVDGVAPEQDGQPGGQPEQSTQPEADKRSPQYRFSKLTEQRNAAAAEAAYWRGQAEALQRATMAQAQPTQPQPTQPAAPAAPDPSNYAQGEFDPAYLRDIARHEAKLEAQELLRQELAQRDEQAREQARLAEGRARFESAAARAQQEGLPEAADLLARVPMPVADLITQAPNPHLVAAYFARRPDVLQGIANLPPMQAAMQVAYIDAQITQAMQASAPAQPAAQAPTPQQPPIQPTPQLSGRGADPFNAAAGSFNDFERYAKSLWGQSG